MTINALRLWMTKEKLTQKEAADRIGVPQGYVSAWLSGRKPGVEYALQIERASNGAVPVTSWGKPRPGAKR